MRGADVRADDLARTLGRFDIAVPVSAVRQAGALPEQPGLYAWWADPAGLDLLSRPFGVTLPPLIYAGQAGASSIRSRRPGNATLRSRIVSNHIRGNITSSTFRLTLASVLREPLALSTRASGGLERHANARLSAWIERHLSVGWCSCADRDVLAHLEATVLERLDPPLNLMGMPPTPVRRRLSQLRSALRESQPPGAQQQPAPVPD